MASIYNARLATTEESREIDAFTIDTLNIPGNVLMETAGAKASEIINNHILNSGEKNIVILCGKGNNAGDGLVIARHLQEFGYSITVGMIAGISKMSKDCESNYNRLSNLSKQSSEICIVKNSDDLSFQSTDVIIDAMLGTGLTSEPRGAIGKILNQVNKSDAIKIALDVPTGINATTGEAYGSYFNADHTIQFGTRKIGLLLDKGISGSGTHWFCSLGFPKHKGQQLNREILNEQYFELENPVSVGKHKYENGVVHIIAGSPGMIGAAVLSAKSAWYAGVGSVQVHAPKGLISTFDKFLIQQVKIGYGSDEEQLFIPEMVDSVIDNINSDRDVVLIGPGLGRNETTQSYIKSFLSKYTGKIVIDADALFTLSEWKNWKEELAANQCILTPHGGELSRLAKRQFKNEYERITYCEDLTEKTRYSLVSKGEPTVVTQFEKPTLITSYPTKIFGRSGFGDVLAGKIAGNWAIGIEPDSAIKSALTYGIKRYHSQSDLGNQLPDPINYL